MGGMVIPDVNKSLGELGERVVCQKSGSGKYLPSFFLLKTIWGTMPLSHCALKRACNSLIALSVLKWE
jgi:hypothetical protein